MKIRRSLRIRGIVQGVGFRPFLYRIALSRGLTGYVLNDDEGVLLDVEGEAEALEGLERSVREEAPPLATIAGIETAELEPRGYERFEIRDSPGATRRRVPVSPDAATCPACLRDILDPANRRHRYPFTNCTHCGPRLTIVRDVPYDRARTTMAAFALCGACRREYEDPADRRFHAQPNACFDCGPRLELRDSTGIRLPAVDPIAEARRLLVSGHILAIKGIGGYHLACDAGNEVAVRALRDRKARLERPFALMASCVEEIEKHCEVGREEKALLASPESPIVLLRRRPDRSLPEGIAPRQEFLGFLLPYSPHLHLLFHPAPGEESCPPVLVMTSANRSDEPIAYLDEEARTRLQEIADYFLLHDRPIHLRCDDSLVRLFRGSPQILRRARGYAPRAIPLHPPIPRPALATGAMLKNTFALGRGAEAIVSHHIGDLENLETYRSFEEEILHYCRLFDHDPDLIVHDLHPDYLSTRFAREHPAAGRLAVQHHEAHIAGVLSEHRMEAPAIGIAFDGTGYGPDGSLWGGEYFLFREGRFERAGSLEPLLLPGGEAAIREPWRVAYALLSRIDPTGAAFLGLPGLPAALSPRAIDLVGRMVARRVNCPQATGAGRYFDAVGAILLKRTRSLHEGQIPTDLEMLAHRAEDPAARLPLPVALREVESIDPGAEFSPTRFRIDLAGAVEAIASLLRRGAPPATLARRFHATMAEAVLLGAARLARQEGIRRVALGGGVFQNQIFLGEVVDRLKSAGLRPLLPIKLPANDGGISYGQLAAASWKLRRGDESVPIRDAQ